MAVTHHKLLDHAGLLINVPNTGLYEFHYSARQPELREPTNADDWYFNNLFF